VLSTARVSAGLALAALVASCSALDPKVGDVAVQCSDEDSDPQRAVDFATQIRPLMNGAPGGPRPCADCHYGSRPTHEGLDQTGLDLETLGSMRRGSRSGPVAVAGSPCKSLVMQKLRGTAPSGVRMPKGGPFWSDEQVRLMSDWIAEGAKGDDKL
jgi:hypothetical protein